MNLKKQNKQADKSANQTKTAHFPDVRASQKLRVPLHQYSLLLQRQFPVSQRKTISNRNISGHIIWFASRKYFHVILTFPFSSPLTFFFLCRFGNKTVCLAGANKKKWRSFVKCLIDTSLQRKWRETLSASFGSRSEHWGFLFVSKLIRFSRTPCQQSASPSYFWIYFPGLETSKLWSFWRFQQPVKTFHFRGNRIRLENIFHKNFNRIHFLSVLKYPTISFFRNFSLTE